MHFIAIHMVASSGNEAVKGFEQVKREGDSETLR